jgi:hypothetical protein
LSNAAFLPIWITPKFVAPLIPISSVPPKNVELPLRLIVPVCALIQINAALGTTNWSLDLGTNAPGIYQLIAYAQAAAGYAAFSLGATGTVTLAGSLPDNTPIARSAKLSRAGIWSFYTVPSSYSNKGMLIGWETNTPSGACNGQLYWYKPSVGAANGLNSTGAAYFPPVPDTQYQIILPGATNSLTVNRAGQFVSQPPVAAITLQPTGILSGAIDLNQSKLPFKAAFISPSAGGAGFIIDNNGKTQGLQIQPSLRRDFQTFFDSAMRKRRAAESRRRVAFDSSTPPNFKKHVSHSLSA